MKALVIETAFLGDAIISIALAEAIRKYVPDAEITYLVRPEAAELLSYASAVDRVITYDKYGSESGLKSIALKAIELNSYNFDTIFALHTSKRTGLLLEKLDARVKIGYSRFSSLTYTIPEVAGLQRTARAISLLKPLVPAADTSILQKLDVSSVMLPVELRNVNDPIVTIAPGSVWMTKRWLPERFAEVTAKLHMEGKSIAFIGSRGDEAVMGSVRSRLDVPYVDLVGKTDIVTAAAVIARSELLIANDSAPVHIATAVGVPTIVLFGPTIREFGFAPPADRGTVCEDMSLWCRPCSTHGSAECPIHTHECMKNISSGKVIEQIKKFTERKFT